MEKTAQQIAWSVVQAKCVLGLGVSVISVFGFCVLLFKTDIFLGGVKYFIRLFVVVVFLLLMYFFVSFF